MSFVRIVSARVGVARAIVHSMGRRGVARRAAYVVARRAGRLPIAPASSGPPATLRDDWALPLEAVQEWWHGQAEETRRAAIDGLHHIRAGEGSIFGRPHLGSWPPQWRPDGELLPWTSYTDAGDRDIKDVWEPSRFGFVGPLLRAAMADPASNADATLLASVDDWAAHNPPFQGENWMCGQESSLRALSILFGVGALGGLGVLPEDDRARIERLVQVTAERVQPTIGYALSQRNNHAISEAVFLLVASMVDPRGQADRRRRASRALSEAMNDQFAADGSYAQYSFTYQRLALHTLLLLDLFCTQLGEELPIDLESVFDRSLDLLERVIEPATGAMPNAGGNDGALLLHLTSCEIDDFRPLVSHLAARLGRSRPFPAGPWDEEAAWFGHLPPPSAEARPGVHRSDSYHVLHSARTHVVLRAGARRHRPAHADMLHLDIWIDGHPVTFDPGTYRYTAPEPWGNALTTEEVHNVPRIPGRPQGIRAGRFLWASWSDATLSPEGSDTELVAALDLGGGVEIRRSVRLLGDVVVVVDDATADGMTVRWNLPHESGVSASGARTDRFAARFSSDVVHALETTEQDPTSGWRSPTYGQREPAQAIELAAEGRRIVSVFGPASADLDELLADLG